MTTRKTTTRVFCAGILAGMLVAARPGAALAAGDGPVQGYGQGWPLGVVVRHVVPPDMAVDFGDGVDAGAPVSWRGGASWQRALADAVAPLGVRVDVAGAFVRLVKDASVGRAPAPAASGGAQAGMGATGASAGEGASGATANASQPPRTPIPVEVRRVTPGAPAVSGGAATVTALKEAGGDAAAPRGAGPAGPVGGPVSLRQPPMPGAATGGDAAAAVGAAPAVPAARVAPVGVAVAPAVWVAREGSTLRKTLEAWKAQAGWQKVAWPRAFDNADYRIKATNEFSGSFEDAVKELVQAFGAVKPPPSVRLHRLDRVIEISIPDAF